MTGAIGVPGPPGAQGEKVSPDTALVLTYKTSAIQAHDLCWIVTTLSSPPHSIFICLYT